MRSASGQVILLVEDAKDDEVLTLRAFEKAGIQNEVVVARDGAVALDYLFGTGDYAGRNPEEVPQVVLLDLNLPRIGGLEVLRRMREDPRTKLVPVIVLTSSKEDEDMVGCYALRANCFVRKPVCFNEFAEAVKNLGMFWVLVNEPQPIVRRTP